MRMKHAFLIGAILCAGVQTGCREKSAAAEQAPVVVKVKTVEMNPISKGVRYSANIEPVKQVELAFKVGGYVDRILQARGVDGRMRDLQAGDIVTKGTALASVRQSEYAAKLSQAQSQASEANSALDSSQAQLAEVGAAFEKARLDFDRAKYLFSSQSLTKADYDAAKTQFEAVEAKHAAARSQVAMLEAKERAAGAQIEAIKAR